MLFRSSSDTEEGGAVRRARHAVSGVKRRRPDEDEHPHFRNFKPKAWDVVLTTKEEEGTRRVRARRPADDEDVKREWTEEPSGEDGTEAEVRRAVEREIKVRRTVRGVERQRIERTVEEWSWVE